MKRNLDCFVGAAARHHKQPSDSGRFLHLPGDFIVYALTPSSCIDENSGNYKVLWAKSAIHSWISALLEASFYLNNFIIFNIAALVEKVMRTICGRRERNHQSYYETCTHRGFRPRRFLYVGRRKPHRPLELRRTPFALSSLTNICASPLHFPSSVRSMITRNWPSPSSNATGYATLCSSTYDLTCFPF